MRKGGKIGGLVYEHWERWLLFSLGMRNMYDSREGFFFPVLVFAVVRYSLFM